MFMCDSPLYYGKGSGGRGKARVEETREGLFSLNRANRTEGYPLLVTHVRLTRFCLCNTHRNRGHWNQIGNAPVSCRADDVSEHLTRQPHEQDLETRGESRRARNQHGRRCDTLYTNVFRVTVR